MAMTAASKRVPEERQTGVTICGSFRRELRGLRRDHDALLALNCEILSPRDVNFVREEEGFVFAAHEQHLPAAEVEEAHLAALRTADFVWLHAPQGYVGPSGAFEVGVATTAGVPVLSREVPRDVALREYVRVVASPAEAVSLVRERLVADPGAGVRGLQSYYRRVAHDRGWDHEGPLESMVFLTEEVGELARAVRGHVGLAGGRAEAEDPAAELADVQLYVVHLANVLEIDLADAVTRKEMANEERFGPRSARIA